MGPKVAALMHHFVHNVPLTPPAGSSVAIFGMGCFWGAERIFWQAPGVITTAVGYAGGAPAQPTYRQVCTGMTGHVEVVRVAFTGAYEAMLRLFWENHDPTQGNRQWHDTGSQYRSVIFTTSDSQHAAATASLAVYSARLQAAGLAGITTEIAAAPPFCLAEDYHQQYLAKNPGGYCGLGGTGVACGI